MSRSYKKHPWRTDGKAGSTSRNKNIANRKVRRYKKGLHKGNDYKKLSCSYDIHDWCYRWSWSEAKKEYENNSWPQWNEFFSTLENFYQYWKKYHYRK